MASNRDELYNDLRARRKEAEERRQKEHRQLMLRLFMVVLAVVLIAALIISVNQNARQNPSDQTIQSTPSFTDTQPEAEVSAEEDDTAPVDDVTVIHIAAAGDLNVTDKVVQSNYADDTYDFTGAFLDVAPTLASADLTVLNFEGILAGAPYGSEYSSAPLQLAQALADIGVDVVQTANSASIRKGISCLESTISAFNNVGITTVGTFADSSAFRQSGGYTMVEVQGVKIAIVAFTKGMDNMGLPTGSENCVNVLYEDYKDGYETVDTDGISKVLRSIQSEEPDLTIAMLHWGSENNEEISSTQKKIKNLMLDNGVDIILGTHSHLVQAIEYDAEASTLVAYSLGDFYGDATGAGTAYSLILNIEVSRDNVTGETLITGYEYTPIYTLQDDQSIAGGHRVVRIEEAMARYNENYIGSVISSVYSAMENALTRLEQRIAG